MTDNTGQICLWFQNDAEAAARFYAETFPNSSVGKIHRSPADNPSAREGQPLGIEGVVPLLVCGSAVGSPRAYFIVSQRTHERTIVGIRGVDHEGEVQHRARAASEDVLLPLRIAPQFFDGSTHEAVVVPCKGLFLSLPECDRQVWLIRARVTPCIAAHRRPLPT